MRAGFRVAIGAVACALAVGGAQVRAQAVTLTEPPVQLLPQNFGGWQLGGNSEPGTVSLTTVNKAALQECSPLRSQVNTYTRNGKTMRVEAVEFGDRTGAYSAFTLAMRPDMRAAKDVGSSNAVGDGAVMFTTGDTRRSAGAQGTGEGVAEGDGQPRCGAAAAELRTGGTPGGLGNALRART